MNPPHGTANGNGKEAGVKRPDSAVNLRDDYVLTRDAAASARLSLSHYIWHSSFGYNLHPRIQQDIQGKENLQVADIGTGTGIWLLDMAHQLPASTQLDGIDISFGQFPPKEWLPKNVNLRLVDITTAVPEELTSKYDIIHIRHFICVVYSNDPTPLLLNLLRMLKPGGWIQWGEWDVLNRHFTKTSPSIPQSNIDKLEAEFATMRRHTPRPDWPPRLDEYLLLQNMQNVAMEKRLSSTSHLAFMHDLTLLVFQELIDGAELKGHIDEDKTRELRALLDGATRESRMGAAWNLTRCMVIGQKGLDERGNAFVN
ncbi:related to methyltransferase [Ramularia collo-cygni]|uniref:Related to methyltransferase n=1 Tax=Ramularia collo-cygni TaxID=112498 RepID=A0A2D3UPN8_9PEZI|nr:related to methyltransferase [Ramularia collo-cygni]CZT15948.1 related to methyltransferase [Ramularia collo-cygni]